MTRLEINQSLIKRFFYKGVKRDYCAYRIYAENIVKTHSVTTDPMMAGSFFETLCLGSGIDGNKTTDLPRKKLTKKQIANGQTIGDKKIDQVRIEQQHLMFERLKAAYQISVHKDLNTQVKLFKVFSKNDNILIKGELDIFPTTILLPQRGIRLAVIDLKLTGRFSDYGEYCWGTPSALDNIQGLFYNELARDIDMDLMREVCPGSRIHDLYTDSIKRQLEENEPLFFYWVFNYKEKEILNKFIEVKYGPTEKAELNQAVIRTVEEINKNERNGWTDRKPIYENCNGCPVLDCPVRVMSKEVDDSSSEHIQFDAI